MRSETQRGCFKAATCVDTNGNTFFALLEANTRQEQPEGSSWTCVHFGDYASTVAFVLQDASRSDWGSRGSKCAPAGDRPADAGDLDAERRQAWRSALTTATSLPYRRVVVPASTGVDMRAVAEVRVTAGPDLWGGCDENELRLQFPELVVTCGSFWFNDRPKHMDYEIQTRGQSIDSFIKMVSEDGPQERFIDGIEEEIAALDAAGILDAEED